MGVIRQPDMITTDKIMDGMIYLAIAAICNSLAIVVVLVLVLVK